MAASPAKPANKPANVKKSREKQSVGHYSVSPREEWDGSTVAADGHDG